MIVPLFRSFRVILHSLSWKIRAKTPQPMENLIAFRNNGGKESVAPLMTTNELPQAMDTVSSASFAS